MIIRDSGSKKLSVIHINQTKKGKITCHPCLFHGLSHAANAKPVEAHDTRTATNLHRETATEEHGAIHHSCQS